MTDCHQSFKGFYAKQNHGPSDTSKCQFLMPWIRSRYLGHYLTIEILLTKLKYGLWDKKLCLTKCAYSNHYSSLFILKNFIQGNLNIWIYLNSVFPINSLQSTPCAYHLEFYFSFYFSLFICKFKNTPTLICIVYILLYFIPSL